MPLSSPRSMQRMDFEDGTSLLDQKHRRGTWAGMSYRVKVLVVVLSLIFVMFVISHIQPISLPPIVPPAAAPKPADPPVTIVTQASQFFKDQNSHRMKYTMSPMTAPPFHERSGMIALRLTVPAPCGDCLVTWMQAGLEYADGSVANADSGMWFHHLVVANEARSQQAICTRDPERFFGSGNERTPVDLTSNGTIKAGYYIAPSSNLVMLIELMNMNSFPKDASPTMTYEYIPGPISSEFSQVVALWLDVGGCSNSALPAVADTKTDYRSERYTNEILEGRLVMMGGHLHDGGTSLAIERNGEVICETVARYGDTEAFVSTLHGAHDASVGIDMDVDIGASKNGTKGTSHLSSMSPCTNSERLRVEDELSLTAHYDMTLHPPMKRSDGELEGLMGIAILYVAPGL